MLMWMFKILREFFCLLFSCGQSLTNCSTCRHLKMAEEPWTDWHSSVFDCFEDANTCKDGCHDFILCVIRHCCWICVVFPGCYGFWCCPCLACTVSSRFGENTCLPLCDICSLSITAAFEIPLFIPPPAVLALRASIRHRYKIKVRRRSNSSRDFICRIKVLKLHQRTHVCCSQGSLCKDIAVSCFCVSCSWCQMHRELNYRRQKPTVINIVNVQPAPIVQRHPAVMIPTYTIQTVATPRWALRPLIGQARLATWLQFHHCLFCFTQNDSDISPIQI